MIALLITAAILTVTISLDAQYYFDQWYFKKCQVTSPIACTPEEFECLWTKANTLHKTGKILMVVGTATTALPLRMSEAAPNAIFLSVFTVPNRVPLDLIGISCIRRGRNRINQLMNTPFYESRSNVALDLNPTFLGNHINNTYWMGLTASKRFK